VELWLTARQYGEVVLPNDSTGQGPGTLVRQLADHGARRVWRGFCRPGTSLASYTSVAVQG